MRGAPQSGFASAMVRTRSASSEPTRGRPARPRRDFQVQKARKPCRCQRITVSGRTRWSASRHPAHWLESHTQRRRSRRPNRGRFDRRRSRASCCRSARFSSVRSVRVLSAARSAPNRASTRDIALHGSHAARTLSSVGIEFWQTTPSEHLPHPLLRLSRLCGLGEEQTASWPRQRPLRDAARPNAAIRPQEAVTAAPCYGDTGAVTGTRSRLGLLPKPSQCAPSPVWSPFGGHLPYWVRFHGVKADLCVEYLAPGWPRAADRAIRRTRAWHGPCSCGLGIGRL